MKRVLKLPMPHEKQKEFLKADARFVAYGGSRGGGKSFAVRLKAILLALAHPGIKILIMRRSYPELYENHIKQLSAYLEGVAVYKDSDKSLSFPNASRIRFGYCDSDTDASRYQGQEYDVIFIDEATHFTYYQFNCIRAAMRGANNHPKRMYLTCNPGGVGHGWVKRLFIDREYEEGEDARDYIFIRASVYDNKPLLDKDPSYLDTLRSLPEDMRRAWLDGDWEIASGQFFSEFRYSIHVIPPMSLPDGSKYIRAIDYGLDMLACLWAAITPDGCVYIIRELYVPDLIVSDAARLIVENTHEDVYETLAPPDLWSRQKDTGKSMAELFYECGVPLHRVDANRIQGWMQVKEFMSPYEDSGRLTSRLKIFSSCRELIRTVTSLTHDERIHGDAAREPHELTHLPDALRYLLRSDPTPMPIRKEQSELQLFRAEAIRRSAGKLRKGAFN